MKANTLGSLGAVVALPVKRTRILVTGTNTTLDNGEAAISLTAIKSLKKILPNSEFVIGSTDKSIDVQRWQKMLPNESHVLDIVGGINSTRIPRSIRAFSVVLRYIPECIKAEACLDLSGDGYSCLSQHGIFSVISHSIQLLMGILLRKTVIVYAQSVGPFKDRLTRGLASFILNEVNLITVREDLSGKYLQELGVSKPPVIVTADSAFLLEPISRQEAELALKKENVHFGNRIPMGIVASQIIHRWAFPESKDLVEKYESYTDIMARAADYLVERFGAIVILIPQCSGKSARHDDRIAEIGIYRKVKNRKYVKVILGQYTPQELKGIIGHCRLIISSKMHSAIAAISMSTPVVVLAYGPKVHGIFGRKLGLEGLIIDIRGLKKEELIRQLVSKIDYVRASSDQIKDVLVRKIAGEKEKAALNAKLAGDLISTKCRYDHKCL